MGNKIEEKMKEDKLKLSSTIKEIPMMDRPIEKFIKYGGEYLSDSELLAIIIKTGNKQLNCVELSKKILSGNKSTDISGLEYLKNVSIGELKTYPGIGITKAVQIKAVVELASRIFESTNPNIKIKSPEDVYNVLSR